MKFLRNLSDRITHLHAITACIITMLIVLVAGFVAPFFPVFTRETLTYASGWLTESTFILILILYFIIKDWKILNPLTKYLLLIGHLLLIVMYGLWLCINFGVIYPYISAIGFNIATIFRTTAIFTLIYTIFNFIYRRK